MIRTLDPTSELFLAATSRIQQRIAQANAEVSSGSKVSVASDAPDEIAPLLQLRATQAHNTQIKTNLSVAQSNADAADSALTGAISLMETAVSLASQGTNSNTDAATFQGLGTQVAALQQQMLNYSQTTVLGNYIFSGDQGNSPSYALDLTSANGIDQLIATQQATQRIEDPAGGSFAAGQTAQAIFDDRNTDGTFANDNVFNALNSLRLALLANDPTQVANTIANLKAASAHLSTSQSFYGNVQNRIQSATDYAGKFDVSLQTQIGQIQDADVAGAALQLTQDSTQLQAAFQMQAKMPHNTLFDYLG